MPGQENGRPAHIRQPDPRGKLVKPLQKEVDDAELSFQRFARARRILVWLTTQSHYMEPPAFLLYADGSGMLLIGSKTVEELGRPFRKEVERVVGSSRWGTRQRENGAEEITLHVCGLELKEPIPGLD